MLRSSPVHMKIRLDQLRAIAVSNTRAAGRPTSTFIPAGPSCSRWFSCSCCQQRNPPKINFFSGTSKPARLPKRQTSVATQKHTASSTQRAVHPPLPPPLPYSPQSIPFKRQLEVLSLTITSPNPDDSWNAYHGIHESLRSHVPDSAYRLLLEKQLSRPGGWKRTAVLLRFAQGCGMDLADLGRDCVNKSFSAGINVLSQGKSTELQADTKLVGELWVAAKKIAKGNYALIPVDTQRDWLRLLLLRYRNGRQKRIEMVKGMWDTIDEMASCGLTEGYKHEVGEILMLEQKIDVFAQTESLKRMVIYLSKGGVLSDGVMRDWVTLVHDAARNAETTGVSKEDEPILLVEKILQVAVRALDEQKGPVSAAEYVQRGLRYAQQQYPSLQWQHQALMEERHPTIKRVVDVGMAILDPRRRRGIPQVDMAIAALEKGCQSGRTSSFQLVMRICEVIEGMIGRYAHEEMDRVIQSLVQVLKVNHTLMRTDPAVLLRLLRLIVRLPLDRQAVHHLFRPFDSSEWHNPSDPLVAIPSPLRLSSFFHRDEPSPLAPAYMLARQIYPILRANHPGPLWTESNTSLWQSLFRISLYAGSTQHAFTSRLYADYQADGLKVPEVDAIAMIHAITVAPPSTRAILLERYIKDYEWVGYEDKEELVAYLIEGLCYRGNTNDAFLAFTLSKQILGERMFTFGSARTIIQTLIARPRGENLLRAIEVMNSARLPDRHTLRLYNRLISSLVTLPMEPRGDTMTREDGLANALALYKDMAGRGIEPDEHTYSLIIRGLMKVGYDDQALGMAKAALKSGVKVFAQRIGALVMRLLHRERVEDAEELMEIWSQMAAERNVEVEELDGNLEDLEETGAMSILGAAAMIRVAKGEIVDWDDMEERYGYKITSRTMELCQTIETRLEMRRSKAAIPVETIGRRETDDQGQSVSLGAYGMTAWQS